MPGFDPSPALQASEFSPDHTDAAEAGISFSSFAFRCKVFVLRPLWMFLPGFGVAEMLEAMQPDKRIRLTYDQNTNSFGKYVYPLPTPPPPPPSTPPLTPPVALKILDLPAPPPPLSARRVSLAPTPMRRFSGCNAHGPGLSQGDPMCAFFYSDYVRRLNLTLNGIRYEYNLPRPPSMVTEAWAKL